MRKYIIIFIVVFLVLDLVLLIGFFGRKSTSPTTTPTTVAQKSTAPAGALKTQVPGNALPIAADHPFVTNVIVEYTFVSVIRTLAPRNLTLKVGKAQELPRVIIDKDTTFFKLTEGQIYPLSYSDLQKNQNVKVDALYNFKSGHWRADKITILAPSTTNQ